MTTQTQTRTPEFPLHYRIRLAMEISGVEADDLAEEMGVHSNTIHNYAAGRTKPKRLALKAIAERTGVSLAWLEGGDASMSKAVHLGSLRKPTTSDLVRWARGHPSMTFRAAA